MFKLEAVRCSYDGGDTYVGGNIQKVMYVKEGEEISICLLNSWTMGSCAARHLFQFETFIYFDDALAEEFFEFLDEQDREWYNSRNIYMFLSHSQVNYHLKSLVKGLDVIDHFQNRGNGGVALMSLYRWVSPRIDDREDEE